MADNAPNFDAMTPEEIMAWMESLAKRQGADSSGFTTAATYDCLVGTSISTSDSRNKNSRIAQRGDGMNAAAIRNMLDGK